MRGKFYPDSVAPRCYAGTSVFHNFKNIRDAKKLRELEAGVSFIRSIELLQKPHTLEQTFDFPHLREIHRYLFQDLYSWAGCPRSFDMAKNGDVFTKADELLDFEDEVFSVSKQYSLLQHRPSLSETSLVLAESIRKINAYHPFPEGNGRAQRIFISSLGKIHGYGVNWSAIKKWEPQEVFHQAHSGNPEPLNRMFERILQDNSVSS